MERIRQANPFPAICGRICPAPCEEACIFYEEGASIGIRTLERYAADMGKSKLPRAKPVEKGKKIAVIGAGPAGMSAAYFLVREGYAVTIFEAMSEPGGLLRYGVPEFRLPQKILDEQIEELKSLGVEIVTNCLAGRTLAMQEVFAQGHAAVLLTVGAGLPNFSEISGYNCSGVYYAEEFLLRAQMMGKSRTAGGCEQMLGGSQTVVIGGGASALDAARLARRCGQQVNVIFHGLEEQFGVRSDDLQAAIEEGIGLHAPMEVLSIEGDGEGCVKGVHCRRLDVVEKDGKLSLEPSVDGAVFMEAQTVVLSQGRRPNNSLRRELPQLKWQEDGRIWVDPQTGLTNLENIFAAGNVATGAGAVVDAIASGKLAAQKIMEFLSK